ncbi:MAG: hypothetical protein M3Z66_04305 [Chloroflexota bacterium]|nr:hypothetical protein [Chloroflexota bacterium]
MIRGLIRTLLLSVLAGGSLLAVQRGASPAFACVDQNSSCTYSNFAVTSVTADQFYNYYHATITVSDATSGDEVDGSICTDQAQHNCGQLMPCTMQSGTTTFHCDQSGIPKGTLTPGSTAYYYFCTTETTGTSGSSDCPSGGSGPRAFTVPGNPTAAVASRLHVSHQHGKTYLRWYSAARVLGFNVFDGSVKLNHRIVTSTTQWYQFSTAGRIARLHLQAIQARK